MTSFYSPRCKTNITLSTLSIKKTFYELFLFCLLLFMEINLLGWIRWPLKLVRSWFRCRLFICNECKPREAIYSLPWILWWSLEKVTENACERCMCTKNPWTRMKTYWRLWSMKVSESACKHFLNFLVKRQAFSPTLWLTKNSSGWCNFVTEVIYTFREKSRLYLRCEGENLQAEHSQFSSSDVT